MKNMFQRVRHWFTRTFPRKRLYYVRYSGWSGCVRAYGVGNAKKKAYKHFRDYIRPDTTFSDFCTGARVERMVRHE